MIRKLWLPIAALLACLVAWAAAAPPLQQWPFTLHMVRHMLLVAMIAPLVVILWQRTARPLFVVSPLLATLLEFIVVWGWHLPAAHAAARDSLPGFMTEQVSFLVAGLLLWSAVLQPGAALAGAGGLLLTSMHMTLLGALVVLSPTAHTVHALGHSAQPLHALFPVTEGLQAWLQAPASPLVDHQTGGLVMLGVGMPIYLIVGLLLVYRQLSENEPDEESWVMDRRS